MKQLKFYLSFGFKNLLRRKTRSLLLGISLGLLTILSVISMGFSSGIKNQMIGEAKNNFIGESMFLSPNTDIDLLWPETIESFSLDLVQDNLNIENYIMRYRSKSFSYSEKNQMAILLLGGDNNFFDKIEIVNGKLPTEGNEILLSNKIIEKLDVVIGDIISIETTTTEGYRNYDKFIVSGIYKILGISELMAGHIAITNLDAIRMIKDDANNNITELISLNNNQLNINGLKKLNWESYGSLLLAIANTNITVVWIIWGIMMFIITVFLFDSIISIIDERKKEYGIMASLGLNNINILGIVLGELFVLSLLSMTPGILVGTTIIKIFSNIGIPIKIESMKAIMGGFDKLFPDIASNSVIVLYFILISGTLIIGLSSLLKLRKINPAEIMR